MMKSTHIFLLLVLLGCLAMTSCRKYSGFKRDSSGFYYQFHQMNEDSVKPEVGDFIVVNMSLRTEDEIITPMTRNNMLVDDLYRGDIYSALRSMHLGDSATFIFDGAKFYEQFLGMGEYPYGKSPIFADVKLLKIMSKQDLDKAQEMYNEQMKQIRRHEDSLVWDYVDQHFLDSLYKGLHFTYITKGSGPKAEVGQTVEVLYRGFRLDHTEFDRCIDPAAPLTFELGKGQVAFGFDIMLTNMCVGDRVTVILPSSFVFGDKGDETFNIPPYTPLVYELELLNIKN